MSVGTIEFRSARASGIQISQFGSGIADTLGHFGPGGVVTSAIEVGAYNDFTIITQDDGTLAPHLGAESGKLTNCKYISDTEVEISGIGTKSIADVNVFDPAALSTYPAFPNQSSGTLMIHYSASGTSLVNTFNAQLYAYDSGGDLTDAPPGVIIQAFEINASGQTFNVAHSGQWRTLSGSNNALLFTNHSAANGWEASNEHIWVAAITAQPTDIGQLNLHRYVFQVQFA